MRNTALLYVFLFFSVTLFSQEAYKQQVSLQHDNDFVFAIDRYYTTGTFIGYSRLLEGDFIFKREKDAPIQLDLRLGQETYTPRELFERDFDLLERPYAGYLFISGLISKVKKTHIWSLQGEFGLVGPQSLAEDLQIKYHELINTFLPVWEGQIANSIHLNFQGKYITNVLLNSSYWLKNISLQSTASLGTRLSYVDQEVRTFIGKRSSLATSSAFDRIGGEREFYGYVGVAYRYVINNALIEGHPFGDDSPFTLDAVPSIGRFISGIVYRKNCTTYSIVYNYTTKETAREGRLQYTAMTIARSF
ncbi:lipid A deacylase LpxR family protein [uncultured Dokdonia sp.]|uniref:lipid A deacylase LpxR family protein n=1 Tax=uncultured Dokdonia sp. TaxID=575653 RepID=UPI002607036B|nr:lipid A deacylase LpxR family protein [uncultured Dokdonia sp.]